MSEILLSVTPRYIKQLNYLAVLGEKSQKREAQLLTMTKAVHGMEQGERTTEMIKRLTGLNGSLYAQESGSLV